MSKRFRLQDLWLSKGELEASIYERRLSSGFLLIIVALSFYDIVEDIIKEDSVSHVLFEGSFFLAAALGAAYLWVRSRKLISEAELLRTQMHALDKDKTFWKNEASNYLLGLGDAIDKQLSRWNLTDAEKDVALLILKGLSHKEIASVRETSDKTIRHHAASIYRKADLDGRAQLSAFFLEDLLLPEISNRAVAEEKVAP